MKKTRKEEREFRLYKQQSRTIQEQIEHTKTANLWSQEASIRKKLKSLKEMRGYQIKGYTETCDEYQQLLDEISKRLLDDYNQSYQTAYAFEEIIKGHEEEYLKSGIIPLLVTSHIPLKMAEEFERYLPEDPKDEYKEARNRKRTIYLHLGETNTGKTYHAIERLKMSESGIYLAPLRILALEISERLNESNVKCNLMTGEEEILVEGAKHQSSTIEKLDLTHAYEVAVIDEIQMIGDPQRGAAWTRALLGLNCDEIHVCGALNAKKLLIHLLESCSDTYEIKEYVRSVPLQLEKETFYLKDVKPGDALVTFSKRRVLEIAKVLKEHGCMASMIYGDLPPEVRKMQYHDIINGKSKVLVTTDAIGMGVNLPIRRIVFMNNKKFDGDEVRELTSQEMKQIAGRAGRKGIYEVGYVATAGNHYEMLKHKIEQKDDPIKKAVIGPSEVLLQITGLPLKDKLALWSTREEKNEYYRKMDVRDYILILDLLKKMNLQEEEEWKLMRLPFDVHNEQVVDLFMDYVVHYFIRKAKTLYQPEPQGVELETWEIYYQKINLYYSFSKNFNLPFDELWVYEERANVSERINQILVRRRY